MSKVYEIITDRICKILEAGTVPWRKPWAGEWGAPRALASGKTYRGVNLFLLHCESMARGFGSPYWLTFKQALEAGGNVRKGEHGAPVVFWTKWATTDKESGEPVQIPVLRYYTVFNAEQCENVNAPAVNAPRFDFEPIDAAQRIIDAMPAKPALHHGGFRACYRPSEDAVYLPEAERFQKREEYYSTAFHELGHSTGHASRCARKKNLEAWGSFGDHEYSQEELVAEMTAAFLCGHAGIETATLDNSAAYLEHWLKVLRADSKMLVIAAAQAQKAADFILGVKWEKHESEPEPEAKPEPAGMFA